MAGIKITIYKNSALSTLLSIISTIFAVLTCISIIVIIRDEDWISIPVAILFFISAFLCKFLAERIDMKCWWKKNIKAKNFEPMVSASIDFCFDVYNACPGKVVLKKIEALNPQAAESIRQSINSKKN